MSSADHLEVRHVSPVHPKSGHLLSTAPRSVFRFPSLMSSVRDAPLVSARAAGIPKPIYSNPPVLELFSLAEALTWMGVALCCVWAAYITHELSETAAAIILPFKVAAESAEPPRAVASAAMSSEVVSTAAVSPEVAALAAEPPQAAVLTSEQSEVRAPSNDAPPAHHVTVKVTVSELLSCPDDTTVDPLEVATLAAQTPEVSVVVFPQAMVGPATAMEAVSSSLSCSATAMEAVSESSSYVELTREASQEPSISPATATKNTNGLSVCSSTNSHTKHEQPTQPVLTKEFLSEQSVCHVPTESDSNVSTGVLHILNYSLVS